MVKQMGTQTNVTICPEVSCAVVLLIEFEVIQVTIRNESIRRIFGIRDFLILYEKKN